MDCTALPTGAPAQGAACKVLLIVSKRAKTLEVRAASLKMVSLIVSERVGSLRSVRPCQPERRCKVLRVKHCSSPARERRPLRFVG